MDELHADADELARARVALTEAKEEQLRQRSELLMAERYLCNTATGSRLLGGAPAKTSAQWAHVICRSVSE